LTNYIKYEHIDFLDCSIIPVFVTCFLVGGWLDRQQSEREIDGEYCCGTGIKIPL